MGTMNHPLLYPPIPKGNHDVSLMGMFCIYHATVHQDFVVVQCLKTKLFTLAHLDTLVCDFHVKVIDSLPFESYDELMHYHGDGFQEYCPNLWLELITDYLNYGLQPMY